MNSPVVVLCLLLCARTVWGFSSCSNSTGALRAMVLTVSKVRYAHATKELQSAGFEVYEEVPVQYQSHGLDGLFQHQDFAKLFEGKSLLYETPSYRKTFSNFAAFYFAIKSFAEESDNTSSPSDWRFYFEDDIKLHPGMTDPACAVRHGMELGEKDGIISLGMCTIGGREKGGAVEIEGVEYQHRSGYCAHSFGVAKHKARFVADEIVRLLTVAPFHFRNYWDQGLFNYMVKFPTWLVGSDLDDQHEIFVSKKATGAPPLAGHLGMFFQDRATFHTEIRRLLDGKWVVTSEHE